MGIVRIKSPIPPRNNFSSRIQENREWAAPNRSHLRPRPRRRKIRHLRRRNRQKTKDPTKIGQSHQLGKPTNPPTQGEHNSNQEVEQNANQEEEQNSNQEEEQNSNQGEKQIFYQEEEQNSNQEEERNSN